MMTYQEMMRARSNGPPTAIKSLWYSHILSQVTTSSDSHRLKPEYIVSAITSQHQSAYTLVPVPVKPKPKQMWCGSWHQPSDTPLFGRVLYYGCDILRIQHWIQDLAHDSTVLTPTTRPLSVRECPGCSLHNPQTFANSGQQHRNRQLYESYTCTYTLPHNRAVLLKRPSGFFQKGQFDRNRTMTFYVNLSSITADIKACLNLTPLSPQTTQTQLITTSSSPPAVYFHAANDYLLAPNDLRSFISTCFQAAHFDTLLHTLRWADIIRLHELKCIDWTATWDFFAYKHDMSKSQTSFSQSSMTVFAVKLLMNELPVLENLKVR